MIHKIFTVYDSKAEGHLQPFFAHTVGLAIRSFTKAAKNEQHDFHLYAGDYTLFEIGEYDDEKATLKNHDHHVNLGTALAYIKEPNGS